MPELSKSDIYQKIRDYQINQQGSEGWSELSTETSKLAAVLILLVYHEETWSFVFIQRAINPSDIHSGQVAFPGGRVEEQDKDLIDTAIRETYEEIGVRVSRDDILGLLPVQLSRKQYQVRPIIGLIDWPQETLLQVTEVADLFTIPLNWLSNMQNRQSASVLGLPEGATIVYKAYQDKQLWGLTASIVDELINILK